MSKTRAVSISRADRAMSVRTMAYCAFLIALSVVLARLIIPMPSADTRFSIEAIPIFLAGALFGPLAGGMVGFAADFIGCLFSPYGYNPIFAVPPILYGVCGGLFRPLLAKKMSILTLIMAWIPPVVVGSILYQSVTLALMYGTEDSFLANIAVYLSARSIQFGITIVLNILITHLLFRAKVFERAKVWPPRFAKQ